MKSFDLGKFRNVFLQSDGWKVSDCYKPYDDKFLRKDAQDAYEGAKWGFKAGQQSRQAEIDKLNDALKSALQASKNVCVERDELQKNLNNSLKTIEVTQRFLNDADGANKALTLINNELQKRIDVLELEKLEHIERMNKLFGGKL